MPEPQIERNDVASGKRARAFTSNAAAVAAGSLLYGNQKLIPRAFVVKTGTIIVTTMDGTSVTLPDLATPWQWTLQIRAITGGTAADIVILY